MPSLRNILHKREDIASDTSHPRPPPITITTPTSSSPPEFTFLRSDTFGQEVIAPPTHADDPPFSPTSLKSPTDPLSSPHDPSSTSRRSFQLFSRNRVSRSESISSPSPPRRERRLSNLLHRDNRRSRSDSRDSSVNIPQDLPQIDDNAVGDKQEREAAWEKRATVLAQHHPVGSPLQSEFDVSEWGGQSRSSSRSRAGDVQDDVGGCSYIYNLRRLLICFFR